MKCNLSLLTIFITILFTLLLPIGISCCSYNQHEINFLMSFDPNYQQHPCYIQWKVEQDAKLKQQEKRKEELEKSIARNDEIEAENRRRDEEIRHDMYTDRKKQPPAGTILLIIFGVFFAICCCGACLTCCRSDDDSTTLPTTTTTSQNNFTAAGPTTVSITRSVTIDTPVNQTISTTNANNNVNVIETENRRPYSRDSDVPLLPSGVITRQNSLPSYDDAMRMPSAHLKG